MQAGDYLTTILNITKINLYYMLQQQSQIILFKLSSFIKDDSLYNDLKDYPVYGTSFEM